MQKNEREENDNILIFIFWFSKFFKFLQSYELILLLILYEYLCLQCQDFSHQVEVYCSMNNHQVTDAS